MGFIDFEFDEGNNIPFLAVITTSQMNIQYLEESAFLVQISENSSIIIKDSNENILWNENSANKIFYIEDESLSIDQESPLYLLPLVEINEDIKLLISPAESHSIDISTLFEEVTKTTKDFVDIPDFSENIQGFDEIISTASAIVNGGMILVNTDDRVTIDNSEKTFSGIGFARGNKFLVTVSPATLDSTINGEFKLVFWPLVGFYYNV